MSLGAEDAVRRLVTLARDLRRAPDIERRTRGYERQLEALFERVFDDGALASIGDLRLIDDIWEILRENDLDESYPEALAQLKERRAVVADAHAKLSDILDPTVSLRDLLYERLDDWLGLPTSVGVAFTADQETELDIIRSSDDPPDHRLRRFLDQYLAWVEPTSAPVVERLRSVIATHLPVLQEMRDTHAVTALFAERGGATGRALRLSVIVSPGAGEEFGANTVDEAMKMAVRQASIAAFTAERMPRQRSNVSWAIDEPTTYEGASIGLAAWRTRSVLRMRSRPTSTPGGAGR